MKKLALAFSALVIGTLSASAADVAGKALPPVAPASSWTGFYLGANAGGNWGSSHSATSVSCNPAGGALCYAVAAENNVNALGSGNRIDTHGWVGGIQGGYNWQSGNILVGIEFDFDAFHSRGSGIVAGPNPPFPGSLIAIANSTSADWLFTARPRLGFVSNDWLFYGTGGLALTRLSANWGHSESSSPGTESAAASKTKAGWVVGAGAETMLASRWVVGLEYLHVRFNNVSATSNNLVLSGISIPGAIFSHSANLQSNIVRLRLGKLF